MRISWRTACSLFAFPRSWLAKMPTKAPSKRPAPPILHRWVCLPLPVPGKNRLKFLGGISMRHPAGRLSAALHDRLESLQRKNSRLRTEMLEPYEFRSIKAAEVVPWLSLVTAGFAHLDIVRSYFERHWYSDPDRCVAGTFVAIERATGDFVGSVRVFMRSIAMQGGQEARMGGIGEVCTLRRAQHRGIGTKLLTMAIVYMETARFDVSVLHAISSAAHIYQRLGWCKIDAPMHTVALSVRTQINPSAITIAALDFELAAWESTWPALALVYQRFCSAQRLDGCHVRSADYWRHWIRNPAEGYAYDDEERRGRLVMRGWLAKNSGSGEVVGYAIVKEGETVTQAAEAVERSAGTVGNKSEDRIRTLNLLDYAAAPGSADENEALLLQLLATARAAFSCAATQGQPCCVNIPAPFAPRLCSKSPACTSELMQWMYRPISARGKALLHGGQGIAGIESARHAVQMLDQF
jgi:ribosomal protein S18 acetylase RimI-like enzyme